jgi:hypothetical protein
LPITRRLAVTPARGGHDAASSALGYLYQSQWPLVELLLRGADRPDAATTVELYDDVAWEDAQNERPRPFLSVLTCRWPVGRFFWLMVL